LGFNVLRQKERKIRDLIMVVPREKNACRSEKVVVLMDKRRKATLKALWHIKTPLDRGKITKTKRMKRQTQNSERKPDKIGFGRSRGKAHRTNATEKN